MRSVRAIWSRHFLGVVLVFRSSPVAGSWPLLVHRLDTAAAVSTWVEQEPALVGVRGVGELADLTRPGGDPRRADEVLGALVRCAAIDGGDDTDAVLVVLHLLSDGAAALAAKLAHRCADPLAMVVGELACQIRTYPWRQRPTGFAAGLLLDTKHTLWRGELRPLGDSDHPRDAVLVDPVIWAEVTGDQVTAVNDDVDLGDLLVWAARTGVAFREDLRLLLELERHHGYGNAARHRVAADFGINERTVRRRRDRTLAALRAAGAAYLAAAA